MLKNKIYNHITIEILKNFITILLTFTAIAWTVRAVNFLDLMIEDGFSASIYFKYSILNITTIITRFIPLSFLLALTITIAKFERQKELLILWTAGVSKIKIAYVFFSIAFFIALTQIFLGLVVNPLALNESRSLLRDTGSKQVNSVLRSNAFSDTFKGVTFYIEKKNPNNELINIFIKDRIGSLNTLISEAEGSKNTTIIAKRGFAEEKKLILFDGIIQTLNKKNEIKSVNFEKTELSIENFASRTIIYPKVQETSSYKLFQCLLNTDTSIIIENCSLKDNKKSATEALARRIGMPLYIPLISIITSFLLIYKKEKKYNFLKKYIVFVFGFLVLIFAEIILKYTGFSFLNFSLYFFLPLFLFLILYLILIKKLIYERIS